MKWASQVLKEVTQCHYWGSTAVQQPTQRILLQDQDFNFLFASLFFWSQENHWQIFRYWPTPPGFISRNLSYFHNSV